MPDWISRITMAVWGMLMVLAGLILGVMITMIIIRIIRYKRRSR